MFCSMFVIGVSIFYVRLPSAEERSPMSNFLRSYHDPPPHHTHTHTLIGSIAEGTLL
jgi:hypothetical protein